MPDNEFLTTDEVAALMRVAPITVRRWIARGEIPAVTMPSGRGYLVARADVEAAMRPTTRTAS
jgi:excisionase family DNA binding protein